MRVTHLTPALFGREGMFGGGERFAFELARHMALVVPTTLISFGERSERFSTPEGLKVQVLGPAKKVRGQATNQLHPGLVRAVAGADVVHCHQTHTLAAELASLLGRLSGRRVVTTDLGGGGWGFSGYMRTDSWFHAHLHISGYSRINAGHAGRAHTAVIYGGVDTELFSPDPRVPREPLVVFVGRLLPHKGVHDLIEGLPPGLKLEIIGRPYHKQYYAKLKQLVVGKPVAFRHDCDDAELVRAYRRAMCVVLPSIYRDCYGNETPVPELLGQTPLEGMACGAPALVTDVASLPEVVANGDTGFVIPPNNPAAIRAKLEWLRDHPSLVAAMGTTGRHWVLGRFTWPRVVASCIEAYRIRR